MGKIELLAPAGSFEKAKIAFMYGADAIYCGTPKLSLRSRSELKDDDLEKTIKYAHSLGKRVHVAINIFAWDETYEEIKKQAAELDRLGVDAIIVADGGVVDIVREYAPNTEIHISTQANTVSYHTCKFWHRNGAKRIILGREFNKEQIKDIVEDDKCAENPTQTIFGTNNNVYEINDFYYHINTSNLNSIYYGDVVL